jgi:serine/threonine protein kinase
VFLVAMDRYEIMKNIGSGNFGVTKLVRDRCTKEFFAVKFFERGEKVCFLYFTICLPISISNFFHIYYSLLISWNSILFVFTIMNSSSLSIRGCFTMGLIEELLLWLQIDEHVQREIMNHRSLKHPNIVRFKEVCYLNFSVQ